MVNYIGALNDLTALDEALAKIHVDAEYHLSTIVTLDDFMDPSDARGLELNELIKLTDVDETMISEAFPKAKIIFNASGEMIMSLPDMID